MMALECLSRDGATGENVVVCDAGLYMRGVFPDAPLKSLALKYIVRMYFRAFFVGLHFLANWVFGQDQS